MVNGCHASPEAYKPAGAAQARKGRCPAFGRRGLRGKGKARRMGVMRPGTCTGTAPQAGQKKEGAAVRLDKFTAKALGLSRSEARASIRAGQIWMDGAVCRAPDARVPEGAAVSHAGRLLCAKEFVYIMLDKPKGVVSAAEDERDTTVVDLVRGEYPRRSLFPAGRLDKTSTGFVLLTDDGPFAHDILAPGRHVEKFYSVLLDTPLTQEMISGFEAGVCLADGSRMLPALARPGAQGPCSAEVVLRQGVYHQIKRMFGVYGAGVRELRRTAIGGVLLDGTLGPGGWRELTAQELALLQGKRS